MLSTSKSENFEKRRWLAVVLISLLSVGGAAALAGEVINSGSSSSRKSSGSSSGDFAGLPSKDVQSTVLDGREYKVEPQLFLPDEAKLKDHVCAQTKSKNSVCSNWPEAQKSYDAAAKALGVPAQVLICLSKIETNMTSGLTSPVGAKGLTQFMPATARDFARKFQSTPGYREAWKNYQAADGTKKNASAFSAANINSSSLNDADVQIFATAMYFRDCLKTTENRWKSEVGEPPNVKASKMRKMYHYLMISYNAGPGNGEKFIKGGMDNYKALPKETQGYIDNFDACIDMGRFGKTGGGRKEGRRVND